MCCTLKLKFQLLAFLGAYPVACKRFFPYIVSKDGYERPKPIVFLQWVNTWRLIMEACNIRIKLVLWRFFQCTEVYVSHCNCHVVCSIYRCIRGFFLLPVFDGKIWKIVKVMPDVQSIMLGNLLFINVLIFWNWLLLNCWGE